MMRRRPLTGINHKQQMKYRFLALLIFLAAPLFSQEAVLKDSLLQINQFVNGSLLVPASAENPPLVILITGSGPTDRDGNQSFLKNDSHKKLARALAREGIASFRYDKRILQIQK